MLYIDGGDIYIHRGDAASFAIIFGEADGNDQNEIAFMNVYGTNWIPDDGTRIRFSVKCNTEKPRCVIQKDYVIMNGFVHIDLTPNDTRWLPFGEYFWDVRLSFDNADTVEWNTPFNPFSFFVTEVVGNNGS